MVLFLGLVDHYPYANFHDLFAFISKLAAPALLRLPLPCRMPPLSPPFSSATGHLIYGDGLSATDPNRTSGDPQMDISDQQLHSLDIASCQINLTTPLKSFKTSP
jgi:hypothetical protein